jgi:ribonuclease BN (tRNA processing enzyme)
MELTVLGSGTAVPHPARSNAGYWMAAGNAKVLLDCGPTVPHRMAEEQLPWYDLDSVWISHFHLDHCGGLPPLLFAMRAAPETRARTKPLNIFGPAGTRQLLEKFDAGRYKLFDQPFPLEIVEIEERVAFDLAPGIGALALSTPHTAESMALHLRSGERTLVYTSDKAFFEPLATLARRVDLLVIESSFYREKLTPKHLELAEAVHIIRAAAPARAVLTHLYPEWDTVDLPGELERYSPGCEVIQAFDGLRLEL